jgi:hypothetical protein
VPTWADAIVGCPIFVSIGNTGGWRLPTVEELGSLNDSTRANPALPAGHPFSIGNTEYWSTTVDPLDITRALTVDFQVGGVSLTSKVAGGVRRWCVRGGATAQSPQ